MIICARDNLHWFSYEQDSLSESLLFYASTWVHLLDAIRTKHIIATHICFYELSLSTNSIQFSYLSPEVASAFSGSAMTHSTRNLVFLFFCVRCDDFHLEEQIGRVLRWLFPRQNDVPRPPEPSNYSSFRKTYPFFSCRCVRMLSRFAGF